MKYMLDTHTWIWWNINPNQLSPNVYSIIESTHQYDEMLLSAISIWELSKLLAKGRIKISVPPEE